MQINSLNLSKMIVSPLDPEVKKKFYAITGECKTDVDQTALAKYILLMYDPNSPLLELIDGYWSRKYEALELSGFKSKNGKFDTKVEDFVLGKNETLNDLIIIWLTYVAKPKWTHLVFLNESLLRYTRQTMDVTYDTKTELYTQEKIKSVDINAVSLLMDKMSDVVKEWTFSKKESETSDFLDRLYYKTHQELLKIRPEHYAQRLTNGETLDEDCPYGDYKVEKLKFAGAGIKTEPVKPKEQKKLKRGRPSAKI